jgi:hypothetical protein
MSYGEIAQKLNDLLGSDTHVAFDDEAAPKELRFYRADPLTPELVRDAVTKTAACFPKEMAAIAAIFVAFDDKLGTTRRRVVV